MIRLENISKKYGQTVAVYDYSLRAEPGKILALLGPNGSGKSTLIKIMTGLLRPTSGQGNCMGYDLLSENVKIRSEIGYMPQKFSLYRQLTVRENLQLFANIHRIHKVNNRVEAVIEAFGLAKYRNHYACVLSGGWQQRLALAVSVLHQPKVLILDEPTAGVDPDSRQIIWQQIQNLSAKNMTIFVATHFMDEAVKCHLLQFLFFGNVVASGSRQDIIKTSGLTTWEIHGGQVRELMGDLQVVEPKLQVLEYGDHLRVSSLNRESESYLFQKTKALACRIRRGQPSLEDCFVHYSNVCKDGRL